MSNQFHKRLKITVILVFLIAISVAIILPASVSEARVSLAELLARIQALEEQQEAILLDVVPAGTIVMWSGTVEKIPKGWALCDGTEPTPDLTSRFIVGADVPSGDYSVGDTGGEYEINLNESHLPRHMHGLSGAYTTMDGAHQHLFFDKYQSPAHINVAGGNDISVVLQLSLDDINNGTDWEPQHDHLLLGTTDLEGQMPTAAIDNRPPFYALAFIMKLPTP